MASRRGASGPLGPSTGQSLCDHAIRPCNAPLSLDCETCGNGVREGGENCDGLDLTVDEVGVVPQCTDFGCAGGTLSCTAMCELDFSDCDDPALDTSAGPRRATCSRLERTSALRTRRLPGDLVKDPPRRIPRASHERAQASAPFLAQRILQANSAVIPVRLVVFFAAALGSFVACAPRNHDESTLTADGAESRAAASKKCSDGSWTKWYSPNPLACPGIQVQRGCNVNAKASVVRFRNVDPSNDISFEWQGRDEETLPHHPLVHHSALVRRSTAAPIRDDRIGCNTSSFAVNVWNCTASTLSPNLQELDVARCAMSEWTVNNPAFTSIQTKHRCTKTRQYPDGALLASFRNLGDMATTVEFRAIAAGGKPGKTRTLPLRAGVWTSGWLLIAKSCDKYSRPDITAAAP